MATFQLAPLIAAQHRVEYYIKDYLRNNSIRNTDDGLERFRYDIELEMAKVEKAVVFKYGLAMSLSIQQVEKEGLITTITWGEV